ncbi:DgyrCDS4764 [Dimorphilus gyrociliatus]|uniref:DgyrCDS4764 n=1 Tax=Dimorphilus gyrociliatus TaxID=2664684 RepID=A0A7I8VKK4_9ANNE|nr:DgyrCDS4764 [Dimorphilus gyrociliatus]
MNGDESCPHPGSIDRNNEKDTFIEHEKAEVDFVSREDLRANNKTDDFEQAPDGGARAWLVCLASFWTNGAIFSVLNTFSVLYVQIMKDFKEDNDSDLAFRATWVGSLQISMTFFMAPIASILVDRFGIRPISFIGAILATSGMLLSSFMTKLGLLYLTYGLMTGIGSSLVYTSSLVILGHYFKKYLGVVNGIVACGSAIFTIILPFIVSPLLKNIGLKGTLRVLTVQFGILVFCSVIWKPRFQQKHTELDTYLHSSSTSVRERVGGCLKFVRKFLNIDIWKCKGYLVWALSIPVAFVGYFIPLVHLVKHTSDVFPDNNGSLLVTCLGITSGVGRLLFGKLADMNGVNRVRMQQISFFVFGIVTIAIPFARVFWQLIIISLIMGLCDGCFVCLIGPIAFDLLGPSGAAQGVGFVLGLMSLPLTAGAPLGGFLYDYLKSYDVAFWSAGIPPLLGALLLFLMPKYESQTSKTLAESIVAMSVHDLSKPG